MKQCTFLAIVGAFAAQSASAGAITSHASGTTFAAAIGGGPTTIEDFTSTYHFPIIPGY